MPLNKLPHVAASPLDSPDGSPVGKTLGVKMKRQTLSLAATLVIAGCNHSVISELESRDSWGNACYRSFEKHVLALSGSGAKDCGFFTIESDASVKSSVRSCASSVIQAAKPFRFGHRAAGDDSWFCDVAIRDESGKLWSLFYDSDVSGSGSGPSTIWVSECQSIAIEPGTIGQDSFFHLTGCQERRDIKLKLLGK